MNFHKPQDRLTFAIVVFAIAALALTAPTYGYQVAPKSKLKTTGGKIKTIAPDKVVIQKDASKETYTYKVITETNVFVDGKPATIKSLTVGMPVVVKYDAGSPRLASEIRAVAVKAGSDRPATTKSDPKDQTDKRPVARRKPTAGLGVFAAPSPVGALILDTVEGSPARKLGLKQGDYVMQFDGKKVTSANHLVSLIGRAKLNQRVEIKMWRDGKTDAGRVRLTTYNAAPDKAISSLGTALLAAHAKSESGSSETTEVTVRNPYGISFRSAKNGIVVNRLTATSAAAKAGLQRGDRIVTVNGQAVGSIAAVERALAPAVAAELAVEVIRNGQRRRLTFPAVQVRRSRQIRDRVNRR